MDTPDLESILARRDLAGAEAARAHVGPHSVFLSNHYWRTQDWVERSLVVHMVQDQRGPHLRSLFNDFLCAPEPASEYSEHVALAKAVCLAQLRGDPSLVAHYQDDREALRRDVEAEVGGTPAPTPVPELLGAPTPVAPPAPAALAALDSPRRSSSGPAQPPDPSTQRLPVVLGALVLLMIIVALVVALQPGWASTQGP
ncbi:MAG: hypothetical protein R3B40_07625 [Polyangiales bacterium]|nr:hypothetical protein [Myxococcales bacterium]MCB9660621.1 hypothetical protein [Sandaracinaceae bacterium]